MQADSGTTIAAFGDSLVHGYGLQQGDGFVPQLQKWLLGKGNDARILNAGVSGDTTAGGLARIDWTLTPEVGGLIVVFGGNDFLRGVPPSASRSSMEGILQAASDRGLPVLLVGHEVPENFGPDYKAQFEAIYPELAQRFGALFYPRFFEAFDAEGSRRESRERYMQDDGYHPNAAGVELIVDSIGPLVIELVELAKPGP